MPLKTMAKGGKLLFGWKQSGRGETANLRRSANLPLYTGDAATACLRIIWKDKSVADE